jgi:4-hydroxy-tetrahydrodipicolinate reductase
VLRVGVFGAGGRMGAAVCAAVRADPELELVAAVDPAYAGTTLQAAGMVAGTGPEVLAEAGAEVAVDFTVAAAVAGNAAWCAAHGVHAVIGTTGLAPEALAEMERAFVASSANCVFAPNFAIGAVLMMRFAELAAPWFETVEVVELHHDGKLDSPSGTALQTARRISVARAASVGAGAASSTGAVSNPGAASGPATAPGGDGPARGLEGAPGVRVHSVRLRGLVAHQEVLFGTTGQTLTLRHDSMDRASFMPGVVLAIKAVPGRRGFTIGLDALLGL